MKKVLSCLVILICFVFVLSLSSADATYVGSAKCKMCHKSEKQGKQYPIWQGVKHSQSIKALSTEKAAAIAQKRGIECSPAESPKCLKCHATLYEKAPQIKDEGVTCEVCHGPGSAYKKMSVMKDHAKAAQNGLVEYGSPDKIKEQCLTCHASAHDKPFDFDAAWAKIKHYKPKG